MERRLLLFVPVFLFAFNVKSASSRGRGRVLHPVSGIESAKKKRDSDRGLKPVPGTASSARLRRNFQEDPTHESFAEVRRRMSESSASAPLSLPPRRATAGTTGSRVYPKQDSAGYVAEIGRAHV